MVSSCDWTMHIYGNSITKTHCHTTMEFLLAWFIANPTQQLCCRCSQTFMCSCFVSALSGFPCLRRCSHLFSRVKSCLYYIYLIKIGLVSFTLIDLQLVARYQTTLKVHCLLKKNLQNSVKLTVSILMFISFLLLILVLSSPQIRGDLFKNVKF